MVSIRTCIYNGIGGHVHIIYTSYIIHCHCIDVYRSVVFLTDPSAQALLAHSQVGLCGNHAYSILDVREIFDPRFVGRVRHGHFGLDLKLSAARKWATGALRRPLSAMDPCYGQDGMVRLLRIRNPHGVGRGSLYN